MKPVVVTIRRLFKRLSKASRFGRILRPRPPSNEFITFWHGPLNPLVYTCLASFARYGVKLRVYSYTRSLAVPPGVILADARDIVRDVSLLDRYIVNGKPSLAKFSNYFRYVAMQRTGACWVDSDIVCLRKPDFARQPIVFGQQTVEDSPWLVNSAVLKLPRRHPMLAELVKRARLDVDLDTKWGVIGPLLVTELVRKYDLLSLVQPRSAFYPLLPKEFWKLLVPEHLTDTKQATSGAIFLHLWYERYNMCGYEKEFAPAKGSFLYGICKRLGTLDKFTRAYERAELRDLLGKIARKPVKRTAQNLKVGSAP
jgi:hypothetical protein